MCGQHQGIIGIGDGVGVDGLVRPAEPAQRLGHLLHVHSAAAEKTGEVERNGIDPLVLRRSVDGAHQVARGIFADRYGLRYQRGNGIDGRDLFNDNAVQVEQQRPVAHHTGIGPRAQHGEQRAEKQQQEQERQPVLDADKKTPDLACETHCETFAKRFLCPVM